LPAANCADGCLGCRLKHSSPFGFHCSHELYPPSRLLAFLKHAERVGFREGMCSDHFNPWTQSQGQSGFTWSWLGAALASTNLPLGMVNAPGQRYHPAIIAQAAATLCEMFPKRIWMSVGTGQALNESITGKPWPEKSRRQERLLECVQVMRALWAGETVNHDGLVKVRDAKLYTRPPTKIALYGAAITEKTAGWVGSWADGLITVASPPQDLKKKIDAFYSAGGAGKPVFVQAAVSFAPTEQEAVAAAKRNWPVCGLGVEELEELPSPEAMQEKCRNVSDEQVKKALRVSASVQQHIDWIGQDLEAGVTRVYLHHVGDEMERFIDTVGTAVLRAF
jgi:coenzyme F420-dependent glucose-6-phosphate dehydrogenase